MTVLDVEDSSRTKNRGFVLGLKDHTGFGLDALVSTVSSFEVTLKLCWLFVF